MPDNDGPTGDRCRLPSLHIARAALHVAAIVDRRGSVLADAQESYWHHATGGTFAPVDLDRGQRLLLDVGLLVEVDGTLMPATDLEGMLEGTVDDALTVLAEHVLAGGLADLAEPPHDSSQLAELVPDAARREEVLLALSRRFDDARHRTVGEIGEQIVVRDARCELVTMGRQDLAREVRRVSLLSDQLGYDISAPRITGGTRLLEVKATTAAGSGIVHLSRNEAEAGIKFSDWALVLCLVESIDQRAGRVVGWCSAGVISQRLPTDRTGCRWEQTRVELPIGQLLPGLPGVVI